VIVSTLFFQQTFFGTVVKYLLFHIERIVLRLVCNLIIHNLAQCRLFD